MSEGPGSSSGNGTGANGGVPPTNGGVPSGPPDRDSSGRLLPGNKLSAAYGRLGGRPKAQIQYDFRAIVTAEAAKNGVTIETAVWGVFVSMLNRARNGDVQAAKLVLDRLCPENTLSIAASAQEVAASVRAFIAAAREQDTVLGETSGVDAGGP